MDKIVIFGIGQRGILLRRYIIKNEAYELIAALDNSIPLKEKREWMGICAYNPNDFDFEKTEYDLIFVTPESVEIIDAIKKQLVSKGVQGNKIVIINSRDDILNQMKKFSIYDEFLDIRVNWTKSYAKYVNERKIDGSVAECGVFKGDFSMYINKFFSEKKLYLFDTFEGFTTEDLNVERQFNEKKFHDSKFNKEGFFENTSEEFVLSRMLFPENCVFKKGFFPESSHGCESERFCFVSLDMDLYQPQLEGIRFFYKRMVKGGVILCHDYYDVNFSGTKKAVEKYEQETHTTLLCIPIGDGVSIAIIKV